LKLGVTSIGWSAGRGATGARTALRSGALTRRGLRSRLLITGIQYARYAQRRNRRRAALAGRSRRGEKGVTKPDVLPTLPAASSAGRNPFLPGRIRDQPAWINGQNSAIRPRAMIVLTSPVEKNTRRLPCEASSDWRNDSSALSPSTIASTIGAI